MRCGVLPILLLLVFAGAPSPLASAAPPNDLFLLFERTTDVAAYVNGSTVEAWAQLSFPGTPDPPAQVANVTFAWFAPNGTLARNATVDPDASGWALDADRADVEGVWRVEAHYLGTPELWRNRSFDVVPAAWSGVVVLPQSTAVGGNATLTIAPGTTVRCDPGVYVRVKGTVLAPGTAGSPIQITSNVSTPTAGDWRAVVFHTESGNRSVLDHVLIRYAEDGVRVLQAAPDLRNVSVADAGRDGFVIAGARLRLTAPGVARAATGFAVSGGDVTLVNATTLDVVSGVLATGANVTIRGGALGANRTGIDAFTGTLDLADVVFDGGGTGAWATDVVARGERLTFRSLGDAVRADGTARIAIGNSSFAASVSRDFNVTNGARVAVVNGTFPIPGESASLTGGSELTLSNYLGIRVLDHDAGDANLSGASVDVYRDEAIAFSGVTDGNGTVPRSLLLYRRYAPTLTETTIRVRVSFAGRAFEANNRTFTLAASTTQTFRGSAADLDGDGEPDFSDADVDGDGLSNDVESVLGTDPRDPDTDGDGMPDGWEFDYQLDPGDAADGPADRDGDGLTNLDEYGYGTDPRTSDTDGDGMPDPWEVAHGFRPANATDAAEDADGDGFSNLEEFRGGTDPRDPDSYPEAGLGPVWPFALALGLAIGIILVSLVLGRRARKRRGEPPADPKDDEPSGER